MTLHPLHSLINHVNPSQTYARTQFRDIITTHHHLIPNQHNTNLTGYEFPYNGAQIVFIGNNQHVHAADIKSMDDVMTWAAANSGKFTYASPCTTYSSAQDECTDYDYTGSAFVRHFLYSYCSASAGSSITLDSSTAPCYSLYLGDFSSTTYNANVKYAFEKLRELDQYIYKGTGTTAIYPNSQDDVDDLFKNGDIYWTVAYDPSHATSMVEEGEWDATTTFTWLPETSGTISNTNFVAIPRNAKNLFAAMVVANYMGEMHAQYARRQPDLWGAIQSYDPECDEMTTGGWQTAFDYLNSQFPNATSPSAAELRSAAMPELDGAYITQFQNDWYTCVSQMSAGNAALCGP